MGKAVGVVDEGFKHCFFVFGELRAKISIPDPDAFEVMEEGSCEMEKLGGLGFLIEKLQLMFELSRRSLSLLIKVMNLFFVEF